MHRPRIAAAGCAATLTLSIATSWWTTANAQPAPTGPAPGTVLIGDTSNNRVIAVAPDGTQTTFLGTGLDFPERLAADPAGDVFIADTFDSRIVKVAPGGTTSTVGTGLMFPSGVTVDAAGDVLIADSGNNRVVKVAPDGTQTTFLGTGLDQPQTVAVDATGDVLIADAGNNRVVEVAPNGTQTTVGTGLNQPQGLAVDAAGDVVIADAGNNRVVEVAPDGTQTTLLGAGLSEPSDVALDAAGDVLIADDENHRVVKLAPGGGQSTVGTGLGVVSGVAVVPPRAQTITYASTPPAHPRIADAYDVSANGGDSGNPVTFTRNTASAGQCTVTSDGDNSATVTFTGHGYCAVFAHQAGSDDYAPAVAVRQRIYVYKDTQTIEFTSTPPVRPQVGTSYDISAVGGGSGNPVTFTRNSASAGECTVVNDRANSATVDFIGHGTCAVFAHEAGNAAYQPAASARQRIHVYPFVCRLPAADGVQGGTDRVQNVGC